MLDCTFNLYTDDGIILFDPAWKPEDPEMFDACLSFVLDPEGKTNQTEKNWAESWSRAVSDQRRFIGLPHFVPIIIEAGTYWIRITTESSLIVEHKAYALQHFVEPLRIQSGTISLADAMLCFDWEGTETYDNQTFSLASGDYLTHIYALRAPANAAEMIGEFGTEPSPAILIELEPCPASAFNIPSPGTPFPRLSFPRDSV